MTQSTDLQAKAVLRQSTVMYSDKKCRDNLKHLEKIEKQIAAASAGKGMWRSILQGCVVLLVSTSGQYLSKGVVGFFATKYLMEFHNNIVDYWVQEQQALNESKFDELSLEMVQNLRNQVMTVIKLKGLHGDDTMVDCAKSEERGELCHLKECKGDKPLYELLKREYEAIGAQLGNSGDGVYMQKFLLCDQAFQEKFNAHHQYRNKIIQMIRVKPYSGGVIPRPISDCDKIDELVIVETNKILARYSGKGWLRTENATAGAIEKVVEMLARCNPDIEQFHKDEFRQGLRVIANAEGHALAVDGKVLANMWKGGVSAFLALAWTVRTFMPFDSAWISGLVVMFNIMVFLQFVEFFKSVILMWVAFASSWSFLVLFCSFFCFFLYLAYKRSVEKKTVMQQQFDKLVHSLGLGKGYNNMSR